MIQSAYMWNARKKRIYLDHASGTACSKKVFSSMLPYLKDKAFNPGGMYRESVEIQNSIKTARNSVAKVITSQPNEVYFVDGATEANNMAIVGTVRAWQKKHPEKIAHIITTRIEHAAVLETCRSLEKEGVLVTYLDVDITGLISTKELKESLTENTVIVSIGYVNGEIGIIQDIRAIMKTIRHYRKTYTSSYPYVHTDAVQAVNYVEQIGVPQLGIDLMTINGSKIYGPKKIAALFVKNNVLIEPIIFGGNQEKGMRSGTENVPYIIGFTEALFETRSMAESENIRLRKLQDFLEKEIIAYDSTIIINSFALNKNPNIVNISIPNLSHEEIVIRLDAAGFMCSVKSACKAGEDGDSHVIKSLRKDNAGSLRISLGRETAQKDLQNFMKSFIAIIDDMKDVYEKYYK